MAPEHAAKSQGLALRGADWFYETRLKIATRVSGDPMAALERAVE